MRSESVSKRKTWKESLYTRLPDAERDRLGREASKLAVEYSALEERAKAEAAQTSEEKKDLRKRLDAAAREAHVGFGYRMVEVCEVPDYAMGKVEVLRTDTDERVSERDMQPGERQLGLLPGAEEAVG